MRELFVNLGSNSYPIFIENGLLNHVSSYIEEMYSGKKIMIISDDNVYPIYGTKIQEQLASRYEMHYFAFPHGEQSKSFGVAQEIYSSLAEAHFTRSDLIIALGGGVVGDLGGFVASTYLRGVKYIQIPTSLLAQVDSSVGGKVAVDLPQGKNLVGSFYHPKMVLIDSQVLETLPERYFRDGMGEVIKYGCIQSASLFQKLATVDVSEGMSDILSEVIYECVDCKRRIVEEDPYDTGKRMLLNFGHTLGHAVEQYYGFTRESHGEAVAIGMYEVMKLAEEQGIKPQGIANEIKLVLERFGLPTKCDVERQHLLQAIQKDKKNLDGALNIILLDAIGEGCIYKTTVEFFV